MKQRRIQAVFFALLGPGLGACSLAPAENPGQLGESIPVIIQGGAPLPPDFRPRRLARSLERWNYPEIAAFDVSILRRRPEQAREAVTPVGPPSSAVAKYHVVTAGETLFSLSGDYAVTVRALVTANKLQEPYRLEAGRRLVIPTARSHQVVKGDSIYSLSLRYNLSIKQLIVVNGLEEPYQLYVGQQIILPGAEATRNESRFFAMKSRIQSATSIHQGLEVPHLPSLPKSRPLKAVPSPAVQSLDDQTQDLALAPKRTGAAAQRNPNRRPAIPEPAARASSRFLRPVEGKIISSFGPKAGGIYNDGINIAVAEGTGVRASENGVVVYAGSRLHGFGNMILLKHAEGWLTVYAHNQKLLVAQGEVVKRGQHIALSGQTGNIKKPQVHFEIRHREKTLNPIKYMD